jgi:hypothetical protein
MILLSVEVFALCINISHSAMASSGNTNLVIVNFGVSEPFWVTKGLSTRLEAVHFLKTTPMPLPELEPETF